MVFLEGLSVGLICVLVRVFFEVQKASRDVVRLSRELVIQVSSAVRGPPQSQSAQQGHANMAMVCGIRRYLDRKRWVAARELKYVSAIRGPSVRCCPGGLEHDVSRDLPFSRTHDPQKHIHQMKPTSLGAGAACIVARLCSVLVLIMTPLAVPSVAKA